MMVKNKRALSPAVATILLFSAVIVIALIIFLWFNQIEEEIITKFGKDIKEVCKDVKFKGDFSYGSLEISNTGSTPIFSMKVKYSGGKEDIKNLADNWPKNGLNPGMSFSETISKLEGENIILNPVLLGDSEDGQSIYICEDQRLDLER